METRLLGKNEQSVRSISGNFWDEKNINSLILVSERKGCKRGTYGCKDQLLINKIILEDCMRKKKESQFCLD